MPYPSQARELYNQIQEFADNNTEPAVAIEILNAIYAEATPNLATLLTEYHSDRPVFYPLLAADSYEKLAEVFIYLIKQNDSVLRLRLSAKGSHEGTLLNSIVSKRPEVLFTWLRENKLYLFAMGLIAKNQLEEVIALLESKPIDYILGLLRTDDGIFLDYIVDHAAKHCVKVLNYLIQRDIAIIRLESTFGEKLLSTLCNDRLIYAEPIKLIATKYKEKLFGDEEAEIEDALDLTNNDGDAEDEEDEVILIAQTPFTLSFASTGQEKPLTLPNRGNVLRPGNAIIGHASLIDLSLADTPFKPTNPQLLQFINTERMIENSVLDTMIQRLFAVPLMAKGIVVLPTIRRNEAISPALITRILAKEAILYPSELSITPEEIFVTNFVEITPTSPVRYIMCPVNDPAINHYGLIVIDLGPNASEIIPQKYYYIEPTQRNIILDAFIKTTDVSLQKTLQTLQASGNAQNTVKIMPLLSPLLHAHYLEQLTKDLPPATQASHCVCLQQSSTVNYCADYVLAILAKLLVDELDLTHNAENLLTLEGLSLDESTVQQSRLLSLQQLGMDYFDYQLSAEYQNPRNIIAIKKYCFPAPQKIENPLCKMSPHLFKREKQTPRPKVTTYTPSPLGKHCETVNDEESFLAKRKRSMPAESIETQEAQGTPAP
jgi:hypothetical protein